LLVLVMVWRSESGHRDADDAGAVAGAEISGAEKNPSEDSQPVFQIEAPLLATSKNYSVNAAGELMVGVIVQGAFARRLPQESVKALPLDGCVHTTLNLAPAERLLTDATVALALSVNSKRTGDLADSSASENVGAEAVPPIPLVAVAVAPWNADPPLPGVAQLALPAALTPVANCDPPHCVGVAAKAVAVAALPVVALAMAVPLGGSIVQAIPLASRQTCALPEVAK
jgi:hypothetical protein